jgi:hypothetical protein
VDERAAKGLPAGPLRDYRDVVLPSGNDDDWGTERGSRRLRDPAVCVAADARHVRVKADVEPEPQRVVAQLAGVLVLRDVARELTREWLVREAGEALDRVEPQSVVPLGPAGADLAVALEHGRVDAESRESAGNESPEGPAPTTMTGPSAGIPAS